MIEMDEVNMLKYKDEKSEYLLDKTNINSNLKREEILKCKDNGFILIGKTGVGKTSLLNIIYGEDVGKVGHSSKSETKASNYYCVKEKINNDIIYFCIIDTPGLYDTNGILEDKKQKKDILQLISREKIKIKGLLFLSNFQEERFDASEQISLLEYNALFPMKEFWERIIFIFSHYYGDPSGDTKEEIKMRSNILLSDIMNRIMKKVKNVSSPVEFQNINKKYINIYSKVKNDNQLKNNEDIRKEIILTLLKYIKLNPMFNKVEIFHFEKYEIQTNDEYVYDLDLILYLDSGDNIINKEFSNLEKYYKKDFCYTKEQKIDFSIISCQKDKEGNLININSKSKEKQNNLIAFIIIIISIIGIIFFYYHYKPIIILFIISLVFGIGIYLKNNNRNNNDEIEDIHEIIRIQKIKEEIKAFIENS